MKEHSRTLRNFSNRQPASPLGLLKLFLRPHPHFLLTQEL